MPLDVTRFSLPVRRLASTIACAVIMQGLAAGSADAQTSAQARGVPCRPGVLNGNCVLSLDSKQPAKLQPIKMRRGSIVTVTVDRRVKERVQFQPVAVEREPTDLLASLYTALLPALGKVTVSAVRLGAIPQDSGSRVGMTLAPADRSRDTALVLLVESLQSQAKPALAERDAAIDEASRLLAAIGDGGPESSQAIALSSLTNAERSLSAGLTFGSVQAARVAIDSLVVVLATAEKPDTGLATRVDELASEQARLEAQLQMLATRQTQGLRSVATLRRLVAACTGRCTASYTVADPPGNATKVSVPVTIVDQLVGTSAALTTIDVEWETSRWELSASLVGSTLPVRSYENAPIIEDGTPKRDESGAALTAVTMSTSSPSVSPFALLHYRVLEPATLPRLAVLATAGAGVGVASQSAELLLGGSFRFDRVVFTAGWNLGRDLRLRDGVVVGQELGVRPPTPLPTQRYWTWRPAYGIGLRAIL